MEKVGVRAYFIPVTNNNLVPVIKDFKQHEP